MPLVGATLALAAVPLLCGAPSPPAHEVLSPVAAAPAQGARATFLPPLCVAPVSRAHEVLPSPALGPPVRFELAASPQVLHKVPLPHT